MDLSELIAALESLVLERLSDGRFVRRGPLPAWCLELPLPELRLDEPVVIAELFPFLDTFSARAEEAWRAETPAPVSSGFWTETGADGQEMHLEAYAVRAGGDPVLVIWRNDRLFREQQLVLQRARELSLTHGALLCEMEQKDVLLHTIVHDLAAPLQRILSLLSLLDEAELREPAVHWVQSALQAARLQKQLIGEVLDVFSAEHYTPSVGLVETPEVRRIVRQLTQELAAQASARNVRFDVEPDDSAHHVVCEERRLVRVVTNLIENALRRSPPDAVVRARVRQEGDWVWISVEDQGPAVPVERLARLFEKSVAGSEQAEAGTGLGLYFCRITVEKSGGGIGYEPIDGGGRFWVRLERSDGPDGRRP